MKRRAYKKPRSKKRKIKKPVRRFLDTLALCCGRCCQPRITDLDDEDQRHTEDKEEEPRLVLQTETEKDHSIFSVGTVDIINSSQLHLDDESTDTDTTSQSDAGKQMKNKDIEEELVGDYFKMKCYKIEPDVYEVHLVNVAIFVDFFGKVSNGMSIVLPERVSIGDDNGSEEVNVDCSDKGILDVSTKFNEEINTVIVTEEEDSHSLDVEYYKESNVEKIDKSKSFKEGELLPKNVALFVNFYGEDTDDACLDESTRMENNENFSVLASNSDLIPKNVSLFVDFIGKDSIRFDLERNRVSNVMHGESSSSNCMDEYVSDVGTEILDEDSDTDSIHDKFFGSKLELSLKNIAEPVDFCGTSTDIDSEEERNMEETECSGSLENRTSKSERLNARTSLFSLRAHEQQGLRDWSWCRYISMCLIDKHFSIRDLTSNY